MPTCGAIVVGAGRSERMHGVDKIFAELDGRPVLSYSLAAFSACRQVSVIVVVLNAGQVERGNRLVGERRWSKVCAVVPGGDRRQDSVLAGLQALPMTDYVVVHDAARPLVTTDLIQRGLDEAVKSGAAVAAVPVTDTIKRVGDDGTVQGTLARDHLWAAQTPQVANRQVLQTAYDYVQRLGVTVTDEAAMIELAGHPVTVFTGSHRNLKITTPVDLAIAAALLGVPA